MYRILLMLWLAISLSACNLFSSTEEKLSEAITSGNQDEIVRLLETKHHVVNKPLNSEGDTALILSVQEGEEDLVALLIEKGANPFILNKKGLTAIDIARNSEDEALNQWASLYLGPNDKYEYALELIREKKDVELKLLLQEYNFYLYPEVDENGPDLLLTTAVKSDCLACVEILIEHGYDVNTTDHLNENALFSAAALNRYEAIELLLEAGADANMLSLKGVNYVPLNAAIREGSKEAAAVLIPYSKEEKSKPIFSFLHALAIVESFNEEDAVELADLLLEHGADINAKTDQGATALHTSVVANKPKIAELLINSGIDLMAESGGFTAYDMAEYRRATDILQLFPSEFIKAKQEADANACPPRTANRTCRSRCTNGDCLVVYPNGCEVRVRVQPKFDPFSGNWTYPSPSC